MTTIAILPIDQGSGTTAYEAVAGRHVASGETVGEALDALSVQCPEIESEPFLIVQRFRPDEFFSGEQQRRLADLMRRWREARETGAVLSNEETTELEKLVEAELLASGRRAGAAAGKIGR